MFEKVAAAGRPERRPLLQLRWLWASLAGHGIVAGALASVPPPAPRPPDTVEEATYLVLFPSPKPRTPDAPGRPPEASRVRAWASRIEAPPRVGDTPRQPVEVPLPTLAAAMVPVDAPMPTLVPIRGVGVMGAVADEGAGGEESLIGEGGSAPVVDLALLAEPPELVNRRQVTLALERLYPRRMKERGIGGEVLAMFIIATDGKVEMGSIRTSSVSDSLFLEAAREGLSRMRFRPARLNGSSVRVRATMPLRWVIRER